MIIKKKNGFTLFELLISISIIGILTALAVVSYSGSQVRARNARRVEDMNMIQKAAEQFYVANSYAYPPAPKDFYSTQPNGSAPVLVSWPSDPKGGAYTPYSYKIGVGSQLTTMCACAFMEGTGAGNSTAGCADFSPAATKNYYCVKGQQE